MKFLKKNKSIIFNCIDNKEYKKNESWCIEDNSFKERNVLIKKYYKEEVFKRYYIGSFRY